MQPRRIARRGLCPSRLFRPFSVLPAGLSPERARPARPAILLLALGLTLALAGRSQANVSIDQTALDFGSQDVCTTGAPLEVTVSATGADAGSVGGAQLAVTGPDAGEFAGTFSGFEGSSLSASITFQVTFTPTATGARTATLTITVPNGAPLTVTLTGTGTGTMPPVSLPCPLPTLTFNADAGACQASGIDPPAPMATGPCDTISVTGARSDSLQLTDPYPVGTTTITWTAIDGSGSQDTCTQSVTVVDNQPPAITAPQDLTVNADPGQCTAGNVSLGTPTRGDNCPAASVTNDAPSRFPLGTTTVTWTVTDASGQQATATQKVTVVDNQPPSITAPADVTVPADPGQCTASGVSLGTPVRGDNCGVMSVTNDAPSTFPLGTTTVTWTATDSSGNQATARQKVTVVSNQPAITGVSATPAQLWPPNHQWVPVTIDYAAGDNCGATTCRLSVSNNETGTADAVVVDAHHVQLVATRAGSGSSRVYTITITSTNASGNTTTQTVTVTVPHD